MYFGLFIIFVIKAIQPDCDKIKGISVLLLETPLTRSKYFSPYTHAQHCTQTSRTFYTFAYKLPLHHHLMEEDRQEVATLPKAGTTPKKKEATKSAVAPVNEGISWVTSVQFPSDQ